MPSLVEGGRGKGGKNQGAPPQAAGGPTTEGMNQEIKARRRLSDFLAERRYVSYGQKEVRALKRAAHKVERRMGKKLIEEALMGFLG